MAIPQNPSYLEAHTVERSLLDEIAENQARAASRYMPTLTVKQFTEREKQMLELKQMLQQDVDYGIIPGTSKPTLLLPGAQKICTFFGYAPHYEVRQIEDWTGAEHSGEPLFYYDYTCTLFKGADAVGEGRGSCNSWEKKYRYRSASRKCPDCGAASIIKGKEQYGGGWVCFGKKGGCGSKFPDNAPEIEGQETGQINNPDIAEVVNTVQKMGQKRAYIAATLSATGASQYFTQDLEEFPSEHAETQAQVSERRINEEKQKASAVASRTTSSQTVNVTERAEPIVIPEELQLLFADMRTAAQMLRARDMVIGYCGQVYGTDAAQTDWHRIATKYGVIGEGKKPIAAVKKALIELWEVGQHMEKRAADHAAPQQEQAPAGEDAQGQLIERPNTEKYYAHD